MKKILVTTDFSVNSEAGLLFAAQLANQMPVTFAFMHVQTLIRPTSWGDVTFEAYKEEETEKRYQELQEFVAQTYQKAGINIDLTACKYVIDDHASPQEAILAYARAEAIDYICISTRGAGTLKKMIGTHTSSLIKTSDVPIISVPADYVSKPITQILYAADLKNLEEELNKVVAFAQPLGAKVELLHFNSIAETLDEENVQATIQKFSEYEVKVHLENPDYVKSLVTHIKEAAQQSNASMLVMFTEQNRSFFQKIFMSSKTADYTFDAKVPLLTFKK